ncbi:hypothetical protein [Paenibacillus xerothermodurans]|uniref:Photosynthesis system II assembly factor Ycf48/Hcf136-like domain-containing protein n=1 Tax=Paenibacillus xerothermodurans TaxID=1977292 RepID=A0A2W1P2U8_PAEXE|nr:hypothetical protein [Paenibacillus xerothermodurans]PZE21458.1 hypothetical protein CBW46_008925 [Paenibacillus xerothermodurans]
MRHSTLLKRTLLIAIFVLVIAGCSKEPAGTQPEQPAPPSSQPGTQPVQPSPGAQPAAPTDGPDAGQTKIQADAAAVAFTSAAEGWIGGKGVIYHTTDGGLHWEKQYTGDEQIGAFTFLKGSSRIGWAYRGQMSTGNIGGDGSSPSRQSLLQTVDGGATWSVISTTAPLGRELHFASDRQGFSGNHMTEDGGKTWKQLPVPPEITGEAYFHSEAKGWAVTNSGSEFQIQQTTDGGGTWAPIYSRAVGSVLNGAVIRSSGKDDIWVQLIGDSGMTQTSYTLLHSGDSGQNWATVVAHSTAGGGPAPGFAPGAETGPRGPGTKPGELVVISPESAYMTGTCPACSDNGTVELGWTHDGGTTWTNGSEKFNGQAGVLSFVTERQGWLLLHGTAQSSELYATSDGGKSWNKAAAFAP